MKEYRRFKAFLAAIIEKIPFIVFSFISSLLTILAAKTGEALTPMEFTTLPTRVLVGGRSLIEYIVEDHMASKLGPFLFISKKRINIILRVSFSNSFGNRNFSNMRGNCEKTKDMAGSLGLLYCNLDARAWHRAGRTAVNG